MGISESLTDSSLAIYLNMLSTYIQYGCKLNVNHVNAALYSLIGSAVNWMLFNIRLACTSNISEERNRAANEVNSTIMTIKKAEILIPKLLELSVKLK